MLAYVFWHSPREGAAKAAYRDAMGGFHRALREHRPAGFLASACFSVSPCPWLPGADAYEDWYLIQDFTALGALNDAASAGPRREPHHHAALLAGWGTGSVYRLYHPAADAPDLLELLAAARWRCWLAKPDGVSYADYQGRLLRLAESAPAAVWQRQLTLGPAPEFCVHAAAGSAREFTRRESLISRAEPVVSWASWKQGA
ncbi:MAG TPA: hypothetical protein VMU19_05305 [Bryobacteraceae bacterium]|nr:hypothetical protein [Bryobacteraceae bacterium]